MYASEVDGQKRTLFVSGKLWGDSLVMADRETGTEWSHILGKAMSGPSEGKTLQQIPSVMTTWESWLKEHPNTSVVLVPRSAHKFDKQMYGRAQQFGIGLVHNDKQRFWRFDLLSEQPLLNESWAGLELAVYFDTESKTPVVWNRTVDDRALTFSLVEQTIRDDQTQSEWNLYRGIATSGPMEGVELEQLPAIVSFKGAWKRFHKDSSHWDPNQP